MKKFLLSLIITLTVSTGFAQGTHWEVKENHKLELNYNLLGDHAAQGAFYGAAGYGLGMWASDNKTGWGIVGSILVANIPILFDKQYEDKEVLIGRNLGAITVGVGATIYIESKKRGKTYWSIDPLFRR